MTGPQPFGKILSTPNQKFFRTGPGVVAAYTRTRPLEWKACGVETATANEDKELPSSKKGFMKIN